MGSRALLVLVGRSASHGPAEHVTSLYSPLSIRHVDLAQGLPPLGEVPPGHGVLLVLWWHDLPLGQLELSGRELGITAPVLRQLVAQAAAPAIGQRLFAAGFDPPLPEKRPSRTASAAPPATRLVRLTQPLARLPDPDEHPQPVRVSVCICTRERPAPLERSLRAVTRLAPPPCEVLVVDNAPTTTATRDVVAGFPEMRYVVEPQLGLSSARNSAIRCAEGEVVAFTDDDVEVSPSWVGRIRDAFSDPDVMAVTGLVLPASLRTDGELVFEKHLGGFGHDYRSQTFDRAFFRGMRAKGVPVWRIGAGANMAFRRRAFDLVGEFDERLGAGAAGCSEDSELWYRLLEAGWRCRYEPAAVVMHHHRSDLAGVREQSRYYLKGHVAALFVQFGRHRHPGNLRRAFFALPRYYCQRTVWAFVAPDPTLGAELPGYAAGLAHLTWALRSPRPPRPIGAGLAPLPTSG